MNNNFVLFDKDNNIEKSAQMIVKFNFEEKDYLVYCTQENEQNNQIFVSRLVLNSEGKYFIDDISTDEKGKLSNLVYNIVILVPSDYEKGADFQLLTNNLYNKFSVKLLNGLPEILKQEYYSGSSIAITSKILVNNAVKLYGEKLKVVNEEVPMWTAPLDVTAPTPIDNDVAHVASPISVEPMLNIEEKVDVVPTIENVVTNTPVDNINSEVIVPVEPIVSASSDMVVSENNSSNDIVLSNPQVEKLAILSDPSLGIGVAQPNIMKNKKAGFANTKYVVIGTVCLVLAIAVIITAYILIKNMG